jgi:hypothetical protein
VAAANPDHLIRFPCQCGVFLTARAALAGRKGKCGKCGHINIIPAADEAEQLDAAPQDAVAIQEICSVCQTPLEADDARVTCGACQLPFHDECWQENLGCSAYGCKNVGALKQGPDIRIERDALGIGTAMASPRPLPRATPVRRDPAEDEFPWAFVLLGGSGIAALLSVVTCGVPSLLIGAAALMYAVARKGRVRMDATIASLLLAGLGAVFGFLLSVLYWMV